MIEPMTDAEIESAARVVDEALAWTEPWPTLLDEGGEIARIAGRLLAEVRRLRGSEHHDPRFIWPDERTGRFCFGYPR